MKGEVKERGMIFNDEMVRAILGGNKTQTRRIVEEKFYGRAVAAELLAKHCPYGQPGDRIWVRETYRVHGKATDVATLVYRASVRNSRQNKRTGFRSRFVINQYQKSGRHQFTCRAGHRAFFWKLPTCVWNICMT